MTNESVAANANADTGQIPYHPAYFGCCNRTVMTREDIAQPKYCPFCGKSICSLKPLTAQLEASTEIPVRPSIAQQSGKLPDSPVKRDSLNGPEALAKPLTESQVRRSLDAASRGEWEGVNVQVITKKLNAIICKKPTKEPPNVGSD